MCLGVPGRIVDTEMIDGLRMGRVAFGGIVKRVCLEYVAQAVPGDYVLVHVGFALTRLDEAEALRVLEMLAQLPEPELEPAPEFGT